MPKDQGGLLDVASSANWVFKRGDVGQYYLRAKIAIPKTDGSLWNGTIEIPEYADSAARIEIEGIEPQIHAD